MSKMGDKALDAMNAEAEYEAEAGDSERDMVKVYEELGWKGQLELVSKKGALELLPVDKFVYDMLLPHTKKLNEFDAFLLPDEISLQIEPYLEEDFDEMLVQYNVENRAGVVMGVKQHETHTWKKRYFGIVEWGMPEVEPSMFEHGRLELAKVRANHKLLNEALEGKARMDALIEYLSTGIEGKALSFYMNDDGTRKSAYASAPSM